MRRALRWISGGLTHPPPVKQLFPSVWHRERCCLSHSQPASSRPAIPAPNTHSAHLWDAAMRVAAHRIQIGSCTIIHTPVAIGVSFAAVLIHCDSPGCLSGRSRRAVPRFVSDTSVVARAVRLCARSIWGAIPCEYRLHNRCTHYEYTACYCAMRNIAERKNELGLE